MNKKTVNVLIGISVFLFVCVFISLGFILVYSVKIKQNRKYRESVYEGTYKKQCEKLMKVIHYKDSILQNRIVY